MSNNAIKAIRLSNEEKTPAQKGFQFAQVRDVVLKITGTERCCTEHLKHLALQVQKERNMCKDCQHSASS